MSTIQVKRGLRANLPALQPGEIAYTTDTQQFFVGTPSNGVVEMASATIETYNLENYQNITYYGNTSAKRNGALLILTLELIFGSYYSASNTEYMVASIPSYLVPAIEIYQGIVFSDGSTGTMTLGSQGEILITNFSMPMSGLKLNHTLSYFLE